jgi:hypothetical protein
VVEGEAARPLLRWAFPAILGVFAAAHLVRIDAPFARHQDAVAVVYASLARNHLDLGLGGTKLGLICASRGQWEAFPEARREFYPNRPFLAPLVLAGAFALLGVSEWVLRATMIAAGLGAVFAFRSLARRLVAAPWDLVATGFFAFMPVFWYFTVAVPHLAFALAFGLGSWAAALRWEETRRARDAAAAAAFGFAACLSDWPGAMGMGGLAAWFLLGKRPWPAAVAAGIAVSSFGLHLLHLRWIDPSGETLRSFLGAPGERSGLPYGSLGVFLASELRELGVYFTAGLLALAAAGLPGLVRGRRDPKTLAVACLLSLGLDEVLFTFWAWSHDFLTYGWAPAAALAAARGAQTLAGAGGWKRKAVLPALVLLAAVQSGVIMADRLTRLGSGEIGVRAAEAVRRTTAPGERTALSFPASPLLAAYYSDRAVLAGNGSGARFRWRDEAKEGRSIRTPEEFLAFVEQGADGADWVVLGDPAAAAASLEFLRRGGVDLALRLGMVPEGHPLRLHLERTARRRLVDGPFLFYRIR